MADELVDLLNRLDQNGISAVAYKGPVLAASIYGNLSLREFGDLDIFVQKENVSAVSKLLNDLGYRLLQQAGHPDDSYNLQFMNENKRMLIEIHWEFTWKHMSFRVDHDGLWKRLRTTTLANGTVRSFSPEDLLLILSAHANKHRWTRLIWICDVAEVIRSETGLDWNWTIAEAKRSGILRILWIGLHLSETLLQTSIPEDVQEKMRLDPTAKSLAGIAARWIASGESPHWSEGPIFSARSREHLMDQARCMFYYLRLATRPKSKEKDTVRPTNFRLSFQILRFIRFFRAFSTALLSHTKTR